MPNVHPFAHRAGRTWSKFCTRGEERRDTDSGSAGSPAGLGAPDGSLGLMERWGADEPPLQHSTEHPPSRRAGAELLSAISSPHVLYFLN